MEGIEYCTIQNASKETGRHFEPRRILPNGFVSVYLRHLFANSLELNLTMSHHLFLLSPSDTPLYSLTHFSTKPVTSVTSPLSSNLPNWSTSAFAGTLTALSGASSTTHQTPGGAVRMGGGQDRHVIQMIANASLDVVEDIMRKENTMCVRKVAAAVEEAELASKLGT